MAQEPVNPASPAASPAPAPTPAPSPTPAASQTPAPAATPAPSPAPSAAPVAGTWREDWRQTLAKGDEKALKRLERFQSPEDIFTSYRALEQRLSSGELKPNTPFPDKGTAEEQASWRQERGLPISPDKYEIKLKDGMEEADKPIIESFAKAMHGHHLDSTQLAAAIEWNRTFLGEQADLREQADAQTKQKTEDALRADWGSDYRTNISLRDGLLATAPADFVDSFMHGRLADGTPIMNSVSANKWLVSMAREINPVTTIVSNAGANISGAIDTEIAAIEKTMRENRKAYNADAKMQERYRQLLGARDKTKKAA